MTREINAHALIAARGASAKRFDKEVNRHRKLGFTDAEIVQAMAGSRRLASAHRIPGSNGKRRDTMTRNRTAVVAENIIQLFFQLSKSPALRGHLEALLDDEFADVERQAIADLLPFD
jgi:hypothetical protein